MEIDYALVHTRITNNSGCPLNNYDSDINVIDSSSGLINGPGGTIDNFNLDDGNYSTHGYTTSSLPPGANSILSTGISSHVVALDYPLGDGNVIVHTIPVEFYQGGPHGIGKIFHRNLFNFAASLSVNVEDTDFFSIQATPENTLPRVQFYLPRVLESLSINLMWPLNYTTLTGTWSKAMPTDR